MSPVPNLGPNCRCGHHVAEHDIGTRRGEKVRTACSVATGSAGTHCGCLAYTPASEDQAVTPC